MKEMVGGCCVCSDERGWPENPLVYCDGQGCTVAVHQACYGIVTVPTGPWYCRKCESQERAARVRCELCPSRDGALKRTDNAGWAHVVCALYIPEVRFGNVTTMEPIILQLIPTERFNKVCYICEELGKGGRSTIGACMQCNKSGCKQQFHVTCAQALGLLCEEAGNYLDNVKYCGYCQHHYSKLKKGGNVKTIPPYKPIPADNHSSDSSPEKEGEASAAGKTQQSNVTSSSGKRKSGSNSAKTSSSSSKSNASASKSISSSTSSHQKTVHSSSTTKTSSSATEKSKNSTSSKSAVKVQETESNASHSTESENKSSDKSSATNKDILKVTDSVVVLTNIEVETKGDSNSSSHKDSGKSTSKKRKAGSRTPTPNSVVQTETEKSLTSAIVNNSSSAVNTATVTPASSERRESSGDSTDKPKKAKTEHSTTPTIPSNTSRTSSPSVPVSEPTAATETSASQTATTSSSIITHQNSLVVSVPLANTSLSPIANQEGGSLSVPAVQTVYQHAERNERSPVSTNNGANSSLVSLSSTSLDSTMVSSDANGGLKITYEKQPSSSSSSLSRIQAETPTPPEETPAKRSRSQSVDKPEKTGRNKKRGSNGGPATVTGPASGVGKRASRSQHPTSPPTSQPGAFSSVTQQAVKDSPPSSPSDEGTNMGPGRRPKNRKSAPPDVSPVPPPLPSTSNGKDSKDIKIFQNGIHAPHMLGNQLNPNSNMAQKMSDHLNSELEAHSIFNTVENTSNNMVGPQLHSRVIASVRSINNSSTGSSGSGSGSLSSMLGGGANGSVPQTLDQLLERQWEQGSQFLMEQAQHFDIASLLSCLHQLRAENLRLEEHVNSLLQRRDHLLAVNARLAIPLTNQQPVAAPSQQHTINNLHPSVSASHGDVPRSRHNSSYSGHSGAPLENGLPPDGAAYPHQHRSPASSQPQPSPTIRHSPASGGTYPSSSGHSVVRSSSSDSRSSQRSQSYPQYQGQVPVVTAQQQQPPMGMRRDSEGPHQIPSSKPS